MSDTYAATVRDLAALHLDGQVVAMPITEALLVDPDQEPERVDTWLSGVLSLPAPTDEEAGDHP